MATRSDLRSPGVYGLTLLLMLGIGSLLGQPASSATCAVDTIGVGLAFGNGTTGALLGSSPGQTFYAADTLLQFLKVWRVASQDSNWNIGMHLYILQTDSTGYPDARRIVLDGPTLLIPDGDGVNPIEFQWTFDPPLSLPHRGLYAFFVFQDPCVAYFDIVATNHSEIYAAGDHWVTGRSACRMFPLISRDIIPGADLVFEIGLCRDMGTRTRQRSWGQLKLLYR